MSDPKTLPVRQFAAEIAASVRDNPITVLIGETGSGKTTQISQILEEAGMAARGAIAITQPRRVVRAHAAPRCTGRATCSAAVMCGTSSSFPAAPPRSRPLCARSSSRRRR
jgi:ATP-dependent RNA helicase DHX8/PRP22